MLSKMELEKLNNQEDPLAMFRPQNKNEKPDIPQDDPLFAFRPKSEQKKFKKPVENSLFKGTENEYDWTELGDKFSTNAPVESGNVEQGMASLKSLASGATLGLSENIPGFKQEKEEHPEVSTFYETLGSFAPIGLLHKVLATPLVNLAKKSPIATRALSSLADMVGWGATGASEKVLSDSFKGKLPEAEDVLIHGAEWMALDAVLKTAGLGGKFASWLIGKSKSTNEPSWQVINNLLTDMKKEGIDISQTDRVTAKVLSEFEKPVSESTLKAKDIKLSEKPSPTKTEQIGKKIPELLESKTKTSENSIDLANKKIEPVQFKKISEQSEALSKPYSPGEIDAEGALNELEKSSADELIETVGNRAETEQLLGKNIQSDIEKSFEEAENVYKPLYADVESGAKNINHKPTKTIGLVKNILEEINSLKVKPEGYQKVISVLNDTLSDLGYHAISQQGKMIIRDAKGNLISLKDIIIHEEIPLSKSMELARRLNKIVDYDLVGPSIKNKLKKPIGSLKNEIKQTLERVDPELHEKFIKAELEYGKTAEKFGTDIIRGFRGEEISEKIADKILEPTILENIKKITSPNQYNEIQREILERLRDMSFDKSRKVYREITPFLDQPAKDAAESIISNKSPMGKFASSKQIKTSIISDLNKAFTTGERPDKVLDLWKTVKGQKLIEESLEGIPNAQEILEYLEKQSFHDFASSVVDKSGEINFEKFENFLKDPATIANIRLTGGQEAVNFFKSLKNMSEAIKFNVNLLEKLPNVKLRPAKETYEFGEQKLLEASEKIKTPTKETTKFKEMFPKKKPEKITYGKGEQKLREAAKKQHPFKFKLEELSEKYSITPLMKSVLSTLGIIKYTKFGTAIIAGKILYKLASRQQARSGIKNILNSSKKATQGDHNITPFLIALSNLDEDFSD